MRFLYTILLTCLLPFVSLALWWQMRKHQLHSRFGERLGNINTVQTSVWIHAASVGEVRASSSFIKALQTQLPDTSFVISTMSCTGYIEAQRQFGDTFTHFFFGIDLPWVWRKVFTRLRPQKLILLERETWPNLISQCKKQQIEVSVINAKFSPRSAKKSSWVKPLALSTLNQLDAIYAQSDSDCQMLQNFGVAPQKCQVAGNMKFDITIASTVLAKAKQLRQQWGTRFVWVAGSTHPSEEAFILTMHQQLLTHNPEALCIIAPRHPKRFDAVWKIIQDSGLAAARFSAGTFSASTSVLLLDTLGDLLHNYAAADVCFVAGSVNPDIGGHNLLEPAALGKAVLTGPHLSEIKQLYQLLSQHHAVTVCADPIKGGAHLHTLWAKPETRVAMGQRALAAIKENQGATQTCLDGIFN